ncbi:MAG: hypothetical protein SGI73_08040 [Chloroflexota bacterium]|nr:hypothetical protein [Chloroflexota bacterium]
MGLLFGSITYDDGDRAYVNHLGQRLVFDSALTYLERANADMRNVLSAFVESETDSYQERYKLPGGGRLQRRGGQAQSGAVKAGGSWDVAYPLEDFGAQIAGDDVGMAYMTAAEMQRHVDTIIVQNQNTVRYELLKRLFTPTATTFNDPLYGALTVQPLANGDSVVYPPVQGSESEATDNHFLESGYAASAISDTNNPYITIREELEEHFADTAEGSNICVFIHPNEAPETEALAGFVPVLDRFIAPGLNVNVPTDLPRVPGKLIGRASGVWISQWRWMPSGYMVGVHLEAPAPLRMRVDPSATGLGRGLQLVTTDEDMPFRAAHWRHRFGFGVGDRLNGVVLELGTGGSYTIPTAYA